MLLAIKKYKESISYGISLAMLFFLLRWLEIRLLIFQHQFEIYASIIAILFTILGVWMANKITSPKVKTIFIEKEIATPNPFVVNEENLANFKISKRELEILSLIAAGKSNQEIASVLFISVSTVKTHIANLFTKLDVKRRTQAIEAAKRLQLLP